jgi:hypothetical protein
MLRTANYQPAMARVPWKSSLTASAGGRRNSQLMAVPRLFSADRVGDLPAPVPGKRLFSTAPQHDIKTVMYCQFSIDNPQTL